MFLNHTNVPLLPLVQWAPTRLPPRPLPTRHALALALGVCTFGQQRQPRALRGGQGQSALVVTLVSQQSWILFLTILQ